MVWLVPYQPFSRKHLGVTRLDSRFSSSCCANSELSLEGQSLTALMLLCGGSLVVVLFSLFPLWYLGFVVLGILIIRCNRLCVGWDSTVCYYSLF